MPKSQKGFTLVELLVTISMMAIVTAGVFSYSRGNENQNNLIRARQRLIFELRRAESMAMNNYKNPQDLIEGKWIRWGITINSDGKSYDIISQTCSTEATDTDKGSCSPKNIAVPLETIRLPADINISSSVTSIYFLSPEPSVYNENSKLGLNDSSITFTITNSASNIKTVTVSPIGQINEGE
jgi:prepilin-type N-terminal cleavage/methylation domain-containing protein